MTEGPASAPGSGPGPHAGTDLPPPPPQPAAYPGTGATTLGGPRPSATGRLGYGDQPPGSRLARPDLGRRCLGALVDLAAIAGPTVIALVLWLRAPREIRTCGEGGATLCEVPTGPAVGIGWALVATSVVVAVALALLEGRTGASPGKRVVGLRTVDARELAPLGGGRNLLRRGAQALLAATVAGGVLDHLAPLVDRAGRTLHDRLAGAAVLDVDALADLRTREGR